jgi:uncharacterized membrane protein
MAHLIVLGFDTRQAAEEVFELGSTLDRSDLLDLADSALVWQDGNGRVRIQQSLSTTAMGAGFGAASGVMWGALIGLVVVNPLVGLVVGGVAGASIGARSGALTDLGIDDDLLRGVGEQLQPGKAAVFVLVRKASPDEVIAAVKHHHPTVLQTDLAKDDEIDLIRALQS